MKKRILLVVIMLSLGMQTAQAGLGDRIKRFFDDNEAKKLAAFFLIQGTMFFGYRDRRSFLKKGGFMLDPKKSDEQIGVDIEE